MGNKTKNCFLLKRNPSSKTRKSTLIVELQQTFLCFTQINSFLAAWGVFTYNSKRCRFCCSKISFASRIFIANIRIRKSAVRPAHKRQLRAAGLNCHMKRKVESAWRKITKLQNFRCSPVLKWELQMLLLRRRYCEEKPSVFCLFFYYHTLCDCYWFFCNVNWLIFKLKCDRMKKKRRGGFAQNIKYDLALRDV